VGTKGEGGSVWEGISDRGAYAKIGGQSCGVGRGGWAIGRRRVIGGVAHGRGRGDWIRVGRGTEGLRMRGGCCSVEAGGLVFEHERLLVLRVQEERGARAVYKAAEIAVGCNTKGG